MNGTTIEFLQTVGAPMAILMFIAWGCYRIVVTWIGPVAKTMIASMDQTMMVNKQMLVQLETIRNEHDAAKKLAATVTARIDACHERQCADHIHIIEALDALKHD